MADNGTVHNALTAIFFHIGSWPIRTYSVCIMLGMIASIASIWYFWKREKYSAETLLLLIIIVIPSSILGARIWYIMGRPASDTNPWYAFWDGGLAIQGAVIFAAIGGTIMAAFHRDSMDMRKAISFIVPNVLIGQVIGRWGNFANHEVFGHVTSYSHVSWLGNWIAQNMFFHATGDYPGLVDGYYIPLFLYESVINLFGWILLVWVLQTKTRRKWFKPGTVGAFYLVWYGIVRVIMEPLRNPSDILHWNIFGYHIEASVATAIIYLIVGIVGAACFQFIPNKYVWNNAKYTWEIPIGKISKRRLNREWSQRQSK